MENNEKQSSYAEILDIINKMKSSIVTSCTEQLMMTGIMPTSAQNELKVLSQIAGAVFNGIISLGTEVFEDENNPSLVFTDLCGKRYNCAKINISNSVSNSAKPLSASEAYSMTIDTDMASTKPVEMNKKVSIEEFEEPRKVEIEKEPEPTPVVVTPPVVEIPKQEEPSYTGYIPLNEEEEFGEEKEETTFSEQEPAKEEVQPIKEEVPLVAPKVPEEDDLSDDDDFGEEPKKVQEEEPKAKVEFPAKQLDDDLFSDDDFELDIPPEKPIETVAPAPALMDEPLAPIPIAEEEDSPEPEPEPSVVPKPQANSTVQSFNRGDMFIEEPSKPVSEMIYNMSKLTLTHIDGGKPEEIIVMIAPLKISRVSAPAVPIIVTLYNRGKVVTKSSYDMGDGGKAIVTIDINEFYFLCRGSFDEDGKFKAFITTTGISSTQGDRLNCVSSKTYGNAQERTTKNGHVKVRYESESGPGTIEVFPFGTQQDDEFVVLVKNPEFCDTYYLSQRGRSGSTAIIYGVDGKLEIVPNWNGDVLEVEVFEK